MTPSHPSHPSHPSYPSHPSHPSPPSLPPGWRWVRLGEVCELYQPETISIEQIQRSPGPYTVFGANGIIGRYSRYNHQDTEVLVSCRGTCGTVNMSEKMCWITGNSMVVHPKEDGMEKRFLFWTLRASNLQVTLSGSAQPQITRQSLSPLEIPLPPLEEQKRIAAILNEQMAVVGRARAAAEARLEAAKALPAAFLRRVFPQAGQALPPGCRWVKIGEVCEQRTGNCDPRLKPDQPFRYVDITGVDNRTKRIVEAKTILGRDAPSRARQIMHTSDVILSTTRPTLNAVAIVPPELDSQICSTGFCVLRTTPDLEPTYLFPFVQTDDFVQRLSDLVKGALYPAVTDKQVREQVIPLPPLEEQKRIAVILNEQMAAGERLRKAIEEELEAINRLPAALLRRAFNGEL